MYKIGVIGGSSCDDVSKNVAELVGMEIVKSKNLLYTGGVGGIGNAAVIGANKYLKEVKEDPCECVFLCLPGEEQGKREKTEEGTRIIMGKNMEERRTELIKEIDAAIAISGGSGTQDEIEKCMKFNKLVIPIPTEGASESFFNDIKIGGVLHDEYANKFFKEDKDGHRPEEYYLLSKWKLDPYIRPLEKPFRESELYSRKTLEVISWMTDCFDELQDIIDGFHSEEDKELYNHFIGSKGILNKKIKELTDKRAPEVSSNATDIVLKILNMSD